MHSNEALRVINDRAALRGSEQKFNPVAGQLINVVTREVSCSRTFTTCEQARQFCKENGAVYTGITTGI